jgi:hypothetical protein
LTAQGLKKIDNITMYGVEATYTALKYFEYGFRYTKRYVREEEDPLDVPSTDFHSMINQDSILLLARLPLLKRKVVRGDVFAGVGGSNTTFTIKSATQDGELTRKETKDWVASPYAAVGGSIGVGYKSFFFMVEAGYEYNKIDKFKRTGNINNNVDSINLSGGYINIGLLFDGLTATSGNK